MATKPVPTRRYDFYRPHDRVGEDGRMVNHVTGEVSYPPSRTKQEFKAECDINNILKQFSATGMLRHVSTKASQGAYEDLPSDIDFQEGLHTVQRATEAFMTLPSKLRSRFGNDPVEFLGFCADPANADELLKLGLRNPLPSAPEPIPVSIISSQAQGPAPASGAPQNQDPPQKA